MQVLEEEGSISPGLALIRTKKQIIQKGSTHLTQQGPTTRRGRVEKTREEEIESRRG